MDTTSARAPMMDPSPPGQIRAPDLPNRPERVPSLI
jgi:hypothetical protein